MPEHQKQSRSRRMLRAIPDFAASLRARRRRSLQFSAVLTAVSLSLVAFLFTGNFLSTQIANSLFKERQEQALDESSSGFSDVQKMFDAGGASDSTEIQSLILETLTILETDGGDTQRQWVLIPAEYQSGQGYTGPMSQSGSLTSSSIPEDLQAQVAAQDGVYWRSSQLSVAPGKAPAPVLIVGSRVHLSKGNDYELFLVYDFSSSARTLKYIQFVILVGFTILLIFVATIVWWVTRSVIRPISQTARTAERLSQGELGERVVIRGENEAAVLGSSFNDMADSIQEQILQLETLSKMQQRFVSDVSHELRTPLTTVKMAAELLYSGREELQPTYQRSTELLYHQVDRFESLLADLLEISRFDAGSQTLDIQASDLRRLVLDCVEAVQPHLDQRDLQVRIHAAEEEFAVEMDSRRIERVLRNLLVNAIEHSEGRPLDIYLGQSGTAVAVAVRDHGVGLTEEQAQHVFDRFWRADSSRKRTLGGTGLGLSIAAEDARLHAGRLEAWGELGEGACFRLTLPRHPGNSVRDSPVGLPPEEGPISAGLGSTARGSKAPGPQVPGPQVPGSQAPGSVAPEARAEGPSVPEPLAPDAATPERMDPPESAPEPPEEEI